MPLVFVLALLVVIWKLSSAASPPISLTNSVQGEDSLWNEDPGPKVADGARTELPGNRNEQALEAGRGRTLQVVGETEGPARPWTWSQVEARLKDDMLLSDLAAANLRSSLIDWPSSLTPHNSVDHLNRALEEVQIQQLEAVVLPYNRQLEAIADSYVNEIRNAQERVWAQQLYQIESTADEGPDAGPSRPGWSVHEYPGWRVSYALRRDELPRIKEFDEQVRRLKQERDSNVQTTMRGFGDD